MHGVIRPRAGAWSSGLQQPGRCGAALPGLQPPFRGSAAPRPAPPRPPPPVLHRSSHRGKENGAETKSSTPILLLWALKFCTFAHTFRKSTACIRTATPRAVGTARRDAPGTPGRFISRPCFGTIDAREWRRRDLVSGTPFLQSFKN